MWYMLLKRLDQHEPDLPLLTDLQARVPLLNSSINAVEGVAARGLSVIRWVRELHLRRREGQILVVVVLVAAFAMGHVNLVCEALIEREEVRPIVNEGDDRDSLLNCLIAENRVIDCNTGHIVVSVVIGLNHGVCNVGYIEATIGFSLGR